MILLCSLMNYSSNFWVLDLIKAKSLFLIINNSFEVAFVDTMTLCSQQITEQRGFKLPLMLHPCNKQTFIWQYEKMIEEASEVHML